MAMDALRDRRTIMVVGMGVALIAGLVLAVTLMVHGGARPAAAASTGELVVQTGRPDDAKVDPARPLRCFVGGRSIGEMPLAACAQRNGVATGALGVGLDASGALAAGADLAASPAQASPAAGADPPVAVAEAAVETPGGAAGCWRYDAGGWVRVADGVSMAACVKALYENHCPPGDSAAYGRWGGRALRLSGGEIEASDDRRTYRAVAAQTPDCLVVSLEP